MDLLTVSEDLGSSSPEAVETPPAGGDRGFRRSKHQRLALKLMTKCRESMRIRPFPC